MYASVRTYAGNRDLADPLAQHERDIRQLMQGIDGFKAYYLVKGDDATTSVSVFENAAGVDESNSAAASWLAENLPDIGATPQVTAGDVVMGW